MPEPEGSPTGHSVVVGLTGAPSGDILISRAAELATTHGSDLLGVHVRTGRVRTNGTYVANPDALVAQRLLLEFLGGEYAEIDDVSVDRALLSFCRSHGASHLVIGATPHDAHDAENVPQMIVGQDNPFDLSIVRASLQPHPADGSLDSDDARRSVAHVIASVIDELAGLGDPSVDGARVALESVLAQLDSVELPEAPPPERIETDAFVIDIPRHRVERDGELVHLTATEWRIVEMLVRNDGTLVTSRQLLESVWGPTYRNKTNYLRVFMAHIRRKLEPLPSRPRYFHTESRIGYRFEDAGLHD